ncbi:MAG: hypothetical protein AB7F74_21280 [Parvibaculaceae bacterium]
MANYNKFEPFIQRLANKEIDWFGSTETYKVAIHTDAPDLANDDDLADLTQISGANGYTTGGANITFNSTRSGGTVTATATDVVFTASGGNLGNSTTGRYFGQYNDTHANDALMNDYDYGSTFTVADGETMTVDYGASLATLA